MIEVLEIGRIALGTMFAVFAVSMTWVTLRTWFFGRDAYEANRSLTQPGMFHTMLGQLKNGVGHTKNRANHGLAIDLTSKNLVQQQRLSEEAIDDVICRRV
ncbi:MAG: hypothetical protein BM560_17855 [Roseobacter sp. MedPE-SWde]|nr:MAG: hypothetical protein BM560_17855 [Roseobacter sp. MedPE-SWde]